MKQFLTLRSVSSMTLFGAMLTTLATQIKITDLTTLSGALIWIYTLLSFSNLKEKQKRQIGTLFTIGTLCLLVAFTIKPSGDALEPLLYANQLIITLLAAVSFLRTIASINSDSQLASGKSSIARTLLGSHIIGAVINISATQLFADRIQKESKLSRIQAITLSRAFGICAFWSPFFAAMGVTLTTAAGAQLSTLVVWGLPVALVSLAFTYFQVAKAASSEPFHGYPVSFESLALPVSLAALVLIAHFGMPSTSVIVLVSMTSVVMTLIIAAVKAKLSKVTHHIQEGLADSSGEVSLFLAAAVLATGISALLGANELNLTPNQFGPFEASVTLCILIGLAMIGVHPVTSNLITGTLLMPVVTDANLLGMTLLFAWSLGVTVSPLSGSQILLQARYGVRARDLMQANLPYLAVMLPVCFGVLYLYGIIYMGSE